MSIESIVNLGIKGDKLIESQLNKLQKQKQNLSKKSDVTLGSKISARREERKSERDSGVRLFNKAEREHAQNREAGNDAKPEKENSGKEKPEKKQESEYSKNLKSELAGAKNQAVGSIQNFNGTGLAQAGIKAVTSAIPVIGTSIGEAMNSVIDAIVSFKDKIKQQSAIVADTADKRNTVTNAFSSSVKGKTFDDFVGKEKYSYKDKKGKTQTGTKSKREDISKAEQAGIISSISGSMGKLTEEFQKEAGKLFTSEDGKKKYDVSQSTALAQGNFGALGTDKGFFMQQISSGFSGLPPSMKQKLTGQMFSMITPEERDVQNDVKERSTQTAFDNLDRTQAEKYVGAGGKTGNNVARALEIQEIVYSLDMKIAEQMSKAINTVANIAKAPDINAAMMAEFKGAVSGLTNSIKGLFR